MFYFWYVACKILVLWPGIKPLPPALGAQSLNDWTTREVLKKKKSCFFFLNSISESQESRHGLVPFSGSGSLTNQNISRLNRGNGGPASAFTPVTAGRVQSVNGPLHKVAHFHQRKQEKPVFWKLILQVDLRLPSCSLLSLVHPPFNLS